MCALETKQSPCSLTSRDDALLCETYSSDGGQVPQVPRAYPQPPDGQEPALSQGPLGDRPAVVLLSCRGLAQRSSLIPPGRALGTRADPSSAALGSIWQWKVRLLELGDFYDHFSRHNSAGDPQQQKSFQWLLLALLAIDVG